MTAFRKLLIPQILGILFFTSPALSQETIQREVLQRSDLAGVEGTEVIVARLTLAPGAEIKRHKHHGDEFVYVLEGGTVQFPGPKQVVFKTGSSLHFPRDEPHAGFVVVGDRNIVVITTHIVDKGKPLMEWVTD